VGKKLAQDKNISAMYNVTGDFDDVILAKFKDRKTMDTFLKNLQGYEHIERTETIIVLNTLKDERIYVD
jgi:DNA-binding Lrp family transcriptional regulator